MTPVVKHWRQMPMFLSLLFFLNEFHIASLNVSLSVTLKSYIQITILNYARMTPYIPYYLPAFSLHYLCKFTFVNAYSLARTLSLIYGLKGSTNETFYQLPLYTWHSIKSTYTILHKPAQRHKWTSNRRYTKKQDIE